MKYKACCNQTCLLASCQTREDGGCYCVCKLVDHIEFTENRIKNPTVYFPGIRFATDEDAIEYYNKLPDEKKKKVDMYRESASTRLKELKELLDKYIIDES